MMTMTQTDTNFFEVEVDGEWVGNVWAGRGGWVAQDFDGDTEEPFATMTVAARFCVAMSQAMR